MERAGLDGEFAVRVKVLDVDGKWTTGAEAIDRVIFTAEPTADADKPISTSANPINCQGADH